MVLTTRQQDELHRCISEYLAEKGFQRTLDAFLEEAQSRRDAAVVGMLEKKWTAVSRLQTKVSALEAQVQALEEAAAAGGTAPWLQNSTEKLPRAPPIHDWRSHQRSVLRVKFHPLFPVLATASEDGKIMIWDYENGSHQRTLVGHKDTVNDVDFHPQGQILASCSADTEIRLWDIGGSWECQRTLRGHDHNVTSVNFAPSGLQLFSASRDTTVRIWETATGHCVKTIRHEGWVRRVLALPQPSLCLTSSETTMYVWNFDTNQIVTEFRDHENTIEDIAYCPATSLKYLLPRVPGYVRQAGEKEAAGEFVVSAGRDNVIRIYHVATKQCVLTLAGHDNWVRSVVFHPLGRLLLSSSDDRSIAIWDLENGRLVKTMRNAHDHFVSSVAICPRGTHVASSSVNNSVRIWPCS